MHAVGQLSDDWVYTNYVRKGTEVFGQVTVDYSPLFVHTQITPLSSVYMHTLSLVYNHQ